MSRFRGVDDSSFSGLEFFSEHPDFIMLSLKMVTWTCRVWWGGVFDDKTKNQCTENKLRDL